MRVLPMCSGYSATHVPGSDHEAAPSALKLMRNHAFESAKGASHISLGQHPRIESE